MNILDWLLRPRATTSGSVMAQHAIAVSSDLIKQMQERSLSNDPARSLLADIWAQRHNVPYITTIFEANQEMKEAAQYSDGNANNDHDKP